MGCADGAMVRCLWRLAVDQLPYNSLQLRYLYIEIFFAFFTTQINYILETMASGSLAISDEDVGVRPSMKHSPTRQLMTSGGIVCSVV